MDVNFHDREIIANPFPAYEEVRSEGRVVRNELLGVWMVPGYADNTEMLMDWRRFSNAILRDFSQTPGAPGNSMLNTDPPEATRLRRMLEEPFRRRSLAALEPRVTQVVDGCLEPFLEKLHSGASIDFVDQFVRSIPTIVICEMMGVPKSLQEQVQTWTDDRTSAQGAGRDPNGAAKIARALAAGEALDAMFADERARRRRNPTDDLLTVLTNEPTLTDEDSWPPAGSCSWPATRRPSSSSPTRWCCWRDIRSSARRSSTTSTSCRRPSRRPFDLKACRRRRLVWSPRTRSSPAPSCRLATSSTASWLPPTAILPMGATRAGLMSDGVPTLTCPSLTAPISAWGPTWPEWKPA